jgi:predicted nucleic acid-binding protein
MILVDTSVLIDYLRGAQNSSIRKFQDILDRKMAYGISIFTYQEILHGAMTETEFRTLREYLDTQTIYFLAQHKESHAAAAALYLKCRKAGYTVKSIIDCLIAQTAIEHGLHLLHQDKDFLALAKAEARLRLF